MDKELRKIRTDVYGLPYSLDCYIKQPLEQTRKKSKNYREMLCYSMETVLNLSASRLSDDKLEILKDGLKHSVEPLHINKTDVLTIFDFIHQLMNKDLKQRKMQEQVKAKMSYLTNNCVNAYKI